MTYHSLFTHYGWGVCVWLLLSLSLSRRVSPADPIKFSSLIMDLFLSLWAHWPWAKQRLLLWLTAADRTPIPAWSLLPGATGAPHIHARSCHGNREFSPSACRWQHCTPSQVGAMKGEMGTRTAHQISDWHWCFVKSRVHVWFPGLHVHPDFTSTSSGCCSSLQLYASQVEMLHSL